jgi:hypothetical protein
MDQFGLPELIMCDGGLDIVGGAFRDFLAAYGLDCPGPVQLRRLSILARTRTDNLIVMRAILPLSGPGFDRPPGPRRASPPSPAGPTLVTVDPIEGTR